jgi:hypothetical protein
VRIVLDHLGIALDRGPSRATAEGHRVGQGQRHLGVGPDVLQLPAEQRGRGEVDRLAVVQRDERVRDGPAVAADHGELADQGKAEQLLHRLWQVSHRRLPGSFDATSR